MSSFECEHCKTPIVDAPQGYITGCEHYPLRPLKPKPHHKRTEFLRVLAEFARAENPVTKSVMRDILKIG